MKDGITEEEALSLLYSALTEPYPDIGILVYASEPRFFIQNLYAAKRLDPALQSLQIRMTSEGIAICHPPEEPYKNSDEAQNEDEDEDDQEIN